jgi:phosphate-selective porin OprO/OprP
MKKIIFLAVLLGIMLLAQSAGAKSLEDILKEKEVITEEEYKAAMEKKSVQYVVGQGFTLLSSDERFKLSIGSRLQFRFTFVDKDQANGNVTDTENWQIPRLKFFLDGYMLSKDLTYRLEANFADSTSPTNKILQTVRMGYRFLDEIQIQGGQYKVPIIRQWMMSDGLMQFVERSNAVDTFKPDYDPGAMLFGKFANGLVNYNLNVSNGLGRNVTRSSSNNAFAGRVTVNPLGDMSYGEADLEDLKKPLFSIGADYFRDALQKTAATTFETNNMSFASSTAQTTGPAVGWLYQNIALFNIGEMVDIDLYSIDAAFKWRGFSAVGEYMEGKGTGRTSNKSARAYGWYAQAGYFIIPQHLEIAVRYSYVDPSTNATNDVHTEQQGAISYYFLKHSLKIQADISNLHQEWAAPKKATDDMQYRVQTQILF